MFPQHLFEASKLVMGAESIERSGGLRIHAEKSKREREREIGLPLIQYNEDVLLDAIGCSHCGATKRTMVKLSNRILCKYVRHGVSAVFGRHVS